MTFMRIAIVGAGLSGLVVAEKLIASGQPLANIDIFEKSPDEVGVYQLDTKTLLFLTTEPGF